MYARICSAEKHFELKLAHCYSSHPMGVMMFLFVALPIGVLLAVTFVVSWAEFLMGLIFGWI